ncbi:MAG TPA: hypothetical protein VEQ10_16240 [Vicinamibacteria bacterium]|nr:hypothetical protein [Vicinamibacteria bacterium]
MKKTLAVAAAVLALPVLALAQQPVVETSEVVVKGTIQAITPATREVTVKTDEGAVRTFTVKPDVKRFGELKVGDRLTARYHEALVMEVRKAGAAAPKSATSGTPTRVAGKAVKPSGAIVQQQVATVEVKAVDAKVPSITVAGPDGVVTTYKVEHPERLSGVKAGDKIDITYTEALIVNVE